MKSNANNIENRLLGFTVLEVTLAALLTLMVALIFYTVFSSAGKEWRIWNERNNALVSVMAFKTGLESDAGKSACMKQLNSTCIQFITDTDTVSYRLDTLVVRTVGSRTDTFGFMVEGISSKSVGVCYDTSIIKQLQLHIIYAGKRSAITFNKVYTSVDLMFADKR